MFVKDNQGNYIPAKPAQVVEKAKSIIAYKYKRLADALSSPQKTIEFLKLQFGIVEHEQFGVLFLDNKHKVISFDFMFNGTIDGASVYPREVVKRALEHNAAAVIFTHNHPSGDPEPSQSDKGITDQLKTALQTIDIRVLDHIIIGESSFSFAENGLNFLGFNTSLITPPEHARLT